MFEQANYSFGLETIKLFFLYFFHINVGFLVFGAFGYLLERTTKIIMPTISKILVGYAFYSTLAWYLYKSGNSQTIVPALIALVLCIAIFMFITAKQKNQKLDNILQQLQAFLKKVSPLLVIQLVLILSWVGFLVDRPIHILVSENYDVYYYGFMSDHVMGVSSLDRINRNEGGSTHLDGAIDCFGVYSWLGLMGRLSMKSHSIEAVMLFQLSLSILLAWLFYEISAVVIEVRTFAAFVPAFIFSFSPLWVYVLINNFLSQLLGTFCLLSWIYCIGASEQSTSNTKNYIFLGFLFYVCFVFSYSGLLLPYVIFMVGSIGVFKYFLCRANGSRPWKEVVRAMVGVTIGIWFAALMYYDLTSYAIDRFFILSNASVGWPLSMLDPLYLLGLFSYSLDHTIFSNWTTYFLLILLATLALIVRVLSKKKSSISAAKYDSILFLSIIALIGYLGVYYLKGDSYQQWKFATYFPLPLLVLAVVNYFAPKSHD